MTGGGENWNSNPWDWITWKIILMLAVLGGGGPWVGEAGGDDGWA